MSDQGEKTCPLCAEEMDLTDQQLKPCKCGYEICVWCWHHIMDMAEKDDTDGRCPACRMSYDKEKIVGTTAKCGRMVAEHTTERKKSHKSKGKTTDGRKQLSSVRVIQRNLVYIVGLPLELADEDLLQGKEFFYQYGKVLKVSLSRTSAGTIQQYANETCSVYITYSNEEEAVRCIQSVHGFILDGRPLRACFGTTKYCHAWLRNVPCTNLDCLYLHDIGSQDDSFTKDEIISAYTRVQQITGITSNMQRRAGNVLPPPADEYCNNSSAASGKSVTKVVPNTPVSSVSSTRGSPPTSSSGRSGALPPSASWGSLASNCKLLGGSVASLNEPSKKKPDTNTLSLAFSTAVTGITPASNDVGKTSASNGESIARLYKTKSEVIENANHHNGVNIQTNVPMISSSAAGAPAAAGSRSQVPLPTSIENYNSNSESSKPIDIVCSVGKSSKISGLERGLNSASDGKYGNDSINISSSDVDKQLEFDFPEAQQPNGSSLASLMLRSKVLHPLEADKVLEQSASSKSGTSCNKEISSKEAHDQRSEAVTLCMENLSSSQLGEDLDDHKFYDAVLMRHPTVGNISHTLHLLNNSRSPLLSHNDVDGLLSHKVQLPTINERPNKELMARASGTSVSSNGYLKNSFCYTTDLGNAALLSNGGVGDQMRRYSEMTTFDPNPTLDVESSIISNILSLDLDSCSDSLTSPQNLAKLFGEADKQHGSLPLSNSWKGHNSNQSRFSFARQDEHESQLLNVERLRDIDHASQNHSHSHVFAGSRDLCLDRLGNGFGYSYHNAEHPDHLARHSAFSFNKLSASRAQVSAPPGFSMPSRPPPPGFSSYERSDHTFDLKSGHNLLEASSLLRNPYQSCPIGNGCSDGDIDLMDPAIIAQGRLSVGASNSGLDTRSKFSSQTAAFDNESRQQMLMQRPLSPQQNLRYSDTRDSYASNDGYGQNPRHMEQSQAARVTHYQQFSLQQSSNLTMSNGHWDGWNQVQGGTDVRIAELQNDRLGLNKFYGGYEDSKLQMPSLGNSYNRSFGI